MEKGQNLRKMLIVQDLRHFFCQYEKIFKAGECVFLWLTSDVFLFTKNYEFESVSHIFVP